MAIIHGRPEAERDLIDRSPHYVTRIEDIQRVYQELTTKLAAEKRIFSEQVPTKIRKEEDTLENIRDSERRTVQEFEQRIEDYRNKSDRGGLSGIVAPLKVIFLKHVQKPRELGKINRVEREQLSILSEWKKHPDAFFNRSHKKQIDEVELLEEIKQSPIHAGAIGELLVLKTLSQLDDGYHILCGLNIELSNYVWYNGRKNLGSAQMDFVVASRNGLYLIEVKNWSNETVESHSGLSPYEQIDRAGKVLWIELKKRWSFFGKSGPRVTKVLLPVWGNMNYNPRYKHVFVSSLGRINYFIQNGKDQLSEKAVNKVVRILDRHITE